MMYSRLVRMAAVLATVAGVVFAQEFRASISGTVADPTGAAVVGAKVVVTDVLKNTTSEG